VDSAWNGKTEERAKKEGIGQLTGEQAKLLEFLKKSPSDASAIYLATHLREGAISTKKFDNITHALGYFRELFPKGGLEQARRIAGLEKKAA